MAALRLSICIWIACCHLFSHCRFDCPPFLRVGENWPRFQAPLSVKQSINVRMVFGIFSAREKFREEDGSTGEIKWFKARPSMASASLLDNYTFCAHPSLLPQHCWTGAPARRGEESKALAVRTVQGPQKSFLWSTVPSPVRPKIDAFSPSTKDNTATATARTR